MNYKDSKNKDMEYDDLKIKSHLDASFDFNKITVSEDLIHRTLEAIHKQTAEEQPMDQPAEQTGKSAEEQIEKKVIVWNRYTRGLAGVAAAAVIIFTGYHLFNGNLISNEKSSSNSMVARDQSTYDTTSQEDGSTDSSVSASLYEGAAEAGEATGSNDSASTQSIMPKMSAEQAVTADDNSKQTTSEPAATGNDTQEAPLYSIEAGTKEPDTKAEGTEEASDSVQNKSTVEVANSLTGGQTADDSTAGDSAASDLRVGATADNESLSESKVADAAAPDTSADKDRSFAALVSDTLTFREIFLPEPERAVYLTIRDLTGGNVITLTEQTDILNFYTVMDKYQFAQATEAAEKQNYSVEVKDSQMNATYLMTVGDLITVNYTDQDVTSQSIYSLTDLASLTQDLQDLINKYSD